MVKALIKSSNGHKHPFFDCKISCDKPLVTEQKFLESKHSRIVRTLIHKIPEYGARIIDNIRPCQCIGCRRFLKVTPNTINVSRGYCAVCIDKNEELTGGLSRPEITCSGSPLLGFSKDPHVKRSGQMSSRVTGIVINDDYFKWYCGMLVFY